MKRLLPIALVALTACDAKSQKADTIDAPATTAQNEQVADSPSVPKPAMNPPQVDGKPTYTKVSKEDVDRAIASVQENRASEALADSLRELKPTPLAHEAFRGPAGVAADATVFLDVTPVSDMNLTGWVIGEHEGKVNAWRFVMPTGSIDEIKSVFFEDVGKDGSQDILITYSYMTGMGPSGAVPQDSTVVFQWEKGLNMFVAHDDYVPNATTAAEARKILLGKGLIE